MHVANWIHSTVFFARSHPSLCTLILVIAYLGEERRVGILVPEKSLIAAASEAPSTTVRRVLHLITSCDVYSSIGETRNAEQGVAHGHLRDSKDSSSKARPAECTVARRAT